MQPDGISKVLSRVVVASVGLAILLTLPLQASHAREVTITTPISIASDDISYDGQDVVISGATVTISGAHTFTSLRLLDGAVINHPIGDDHFVSIQADLIEVSSASSIDLNGLGRGPDSATTGRSGGSHGGRGGSGSGGVSNPTYGDYRQPIETGTGGTGNSTSRGGGAVKLTADELVLEGQIRANGGSNVSYTGGGAGGSIWLDVGVLRGAGQIRADGGHGGRYHSGGGGGGRVAVYYADASGFDLAGKVRALGGSDSSGQSGGAGTVYLKDKAAAEGEVRLINGGTNTAATEFGGNYPQTQITVINARVALSAETVVSGVSGEGGRIEQHGGTLSLSDGTLVVDGWSYAVDGAPHQWTELSVVNGGRVTAATPGQGVTLTAKQIRVDAASSIDLNGLGRGPDSATTGRSGGSHGGRGGSGSGGVSNPTYGDYRQPIETGTGGTGNSTSRGGGAVKLTADELVLEGQIRANGGSNVSYTGGGAGGSIWLDVGVLRGAGQIRADGGHGGRYHSGGGGGGRVAVYYADASGFDLAGKVRALGGSDSSGQSGGAGTVYLKDKAAAEGEVRLINGGTNTAATEFGGNYPQTQITVINARVALSAETVVSGVSGEGGRIEQHGGTLSLSDGTLVVDGWSYAVDGAPHQWTELSVVNGGRVTAATPGQGVTLTAKQIRVDAASSIDLNGLGRGPDSATTGRSGGSHGGRGGGNGGVSNPTYGDYRQPVETGTGGTGSSTSRGGGAVKLTADELVLEGRIRANGGSNVSYTGGGAGGSIWLDVGVLRGAGQIRADGGQGGKYSSGGGGGGRVAVYYADASGFDLAGKVRALGGSGSSGQSGGAGTVYLKDKAAAEGEVRLINGGTNTAATEFGGNYPQTQITVINARVALSAETVVSGVSGEGGRIEQHGGTLSLSDGTLVVDGWSYAVDGAPHQWTELSVVNGGRVTAATPGQGVTLTAKQIRVDAASSIDLNGLGRGPDSATTGRSGGSHGGRGGRGGGNGGVSNPTYGDYRQPIETGTGGTGSSTSRGGGAVKLTADELVLEGQIRANGGSNVSYTGGGAGGSIWLDVGVLRGAGQIRADGGQGGKYSSGGGGGGRVAVYYADASGFDLAGKVRALGGSGSSGQSGGAGTVYLKDKAAAEGEVRLINGGTNTAATEFGGNYPQTQITVINARVALSAETVVSGVSGEGGRIEQHGGTLSLSDGTLVVDGWSYAVDGAPHQWAELSVVNGGRVTAATPGQGVTLTAKQIRVDAASSIDLNGLGRGPDSATTGRSGGSHGGRGGGNGGVSNPTYGDYRQPVETGTGGTGSSTSRGGGAVKLTADELVLEGRIRANGGSNVSYTGGGAGGSIWLDVGVLRGAGQIRADGGQGGKYSSGGGGGGRVAVYYADASGFDLAGKVRALGGSGSSGQSGGAGTVYLKDKAAAEGEVRLINGGTNTAATEFGGNYPQTQITVINARVALSAETVVSGVSGEGGRIEQHGGTLSLSDGTLVVDGWSYAVDGAPHQWAELSVVNGGRVTAATPGQGVTLTAKQIRVDAASSIDLNGLGRGPDSATTGRSGGSHGGRGGGNGGVSNPTYGDYRQPVETGTGGTGSSTSRGGGAVKLTADELVLEGRIRANGGSNVSYTGGGAGGSIWLDVGVLRGAGQIRADGGQGGKYSSGGGGGGRVAVYYADASGFDLAGKVRALGGSGYSGEAGQEGTKYFEKKSDPPFVIRSEPSGPVGSSTPRVELYFNIEIEPASFDSSDVGVVGPDGSAVGATIERIDGITYGVSFATALSDGLYKVAVGPQLSGANGLGIDQDRDGIYGEDPDDVYRGSFTVDTVAPAAPRITNFETDRLNYVSSQRISVRGEREADAAIVIDGEPVLGIGSGLWSADVSLPEGESELSVQARDGAGNLSAPVTLRFVVDRTAPLLAAIEPADGTFLAAVPAIRVPYTESGSGIDLPGSTLSVSRDGSAVGGGWSDEGAALTFSPTLSLLDGAYRIEVVLADVAGLQTTAQSTFTLDTEPPPAPQLAALAEVTTLSSFTVSGTKVAYSGIWLNGAESVANDSATSWSVEVALTEGDNALSFTARDRAGNESEPVVRTVRYDNDAPGPVSPRAVNVGDGTGVDLEWSGYDERLEGDDIAEYRIYQGANAFDTVAEGALIARVEAGTKRYRVTGLERGQQYYFAVVAVDRTDNALIAVTAVNITPSDEQAPEDAAALEAQSYAERLELSWTPSPDTAGDLAGYRLYAEGVLVADIAADAFSYTLSGLQPDSGYRLALRAVDTTGNESPGVEVTGATLLPNPEGLSTEALSGMVDLSWQPVSPGEYVEHYAIYVAGEAFSTVQGMAPELVVDGTRSQARVAGLLDDVTYYFAVTTINVSGGEASSVNAVAETPHPDRDGPELTGLAFDGAALAEGATITRSGAISISARDPRGVGRVEFRLGGEVLAIDTNASDGYGFGLDLLEVADGPQVLEVVAFDTLENETAVVREVTIALAPPFAPVLSAPTDGTTTNEPAQVAAGVAEPGSEVVLYRNGTQAAIGQAGLEGDFQIGFRLEEGINRLSAAARNRGGLGPQSGTASVTLDARIPEAPGRLLAESREQGQIALSWDR